MNFSSGLEKGEASLPDFYRSDELKYHGKRNRGKLRLNFFDEIAQSIGKESGNTLGKAIDLERNMDNFWLNRQ